MLEVIRNVSEAIVVPSFDESVAMQNIEGGRVRLANSSPLQIPEHQDEACSQNKPQFKLGLEELSIKVVRVLVADADALITSRYEFHLSRMGYKVSIACDGLSCVARLREQAHHLVVLDANLLWGRAEGVLALMEEYYDVPDIPVLVTYDENNSPGLSVVRQFGVRDCVAKPLTPQQLAVHVRELIGFPVNGRESHR